mmetsp:Transcript_3121/g.7031  ORF Transcript_3121/g.7031 Transcript_3121/m.7031 type:complete len:142 (+) Transcript_3121:88-513(+)
MLLEGALGVSVGLGTAADVRSLLLMAWARTGGASSSSAPAKGDCDHSNGTCDAVVLNLDAEDEAEEEQSSEVLDMQYVGHAVPTHTTMRLHKADWRQDGECTDDEEDDGFMSARSMHSVVDANPFAAFLTQWTAFVVQWRQ